MKTDKFKRILERYSRNEATREEIVFVERYFDVKAEKASATNYNMEEVQDKVYRQIEASFQKDPATSLFKIVSHKWAIAASILVVFGAFFFSLMNFSPKQLQVSTAYGEKKEVRLPDGTMVILNSGSSLEYPEEFEEDTREITLVGEAFFDVHRDTLKPFVITTGELKTKVLGTSFNINAFQESDSTKVSVVEGKVMVYDSTQKVKEILLPNQQLQYNTKDGGYRTSEYDSYIDKAWSSNVIYFNNTTLVEAAKMLERWYDVTIEIKNVKLAGKLATGKYNNPKLNEALESLSFLMNVEFAQIAPTIYEVTPIKKAPM